MHKSLYRGKIEQIKEQIEKKAAIREAAEEALQGTTDEEDVLKDKIVKKALLKAKATDTDLEDTVSSKKLKTKLKEAEYEAEAAKVDASRALEKDTKMTVQEKIAKKKEVKNSMIFLLKNREL